MAALIHRLYSDKEFRAGLGKKAAETAQQYTWDRNAHDLAAIFKGILRKRPARLRIPCKPEDKASSALAGTAIGEPKL